MTLNYEPDKTETLMRLIYQTLWKKRILKQDTKYFNHKKRLIILITLTQDLFIKRSHKDNSEHERKYLQQND